jgi:HAD superfamily hydrolase (TIGR01458 family)
MGSPTAVLFDIDGVLVVSWSALPGAVEALERVRAAGHGVRFLTNTTSRTRAGITDALREAGFDVDEDEIVTATAAAAAHLRRHHAGEACFVLNHGDVRADLDGVDVVDRSFPAERVGVVLVGGAGPEFSHEAMDHAFACLLHGAALVAAHRNSTWRTDEGLRLDAGPYVAALESAAGVTATVVGKPAPAMFDAALGALGARPDQAVMVGDDLDSDVRGAQSHGLTGVQVRTGKFRADQLDDGGPAPDVLLDSVADLPAWLRSRG